MCLRLVEIFKGDKKEEMYLYVDQKEGLQKVPGEFACVLWPDRISDGSSDDSRKKVGACQSI